jgi:hypothetical protein
MRKTIYLLAGVLALQGCVIDNPLIQLTEGSKEAVVDLNKDGLQDRVRTDSKGIYISLSEDAHLSGKEKIVVGFNPHLDKENYLVIGDFNYDGNADLIYKVKNSSRQLESYELIGKGDGTFDFFVTIGDVQPRKRSRKDDDNFFDPLNASNPVSPLIPWIDPSNPLNPSNPWD